MAAQQSLYNNEGGGSGNCCMSPPYVSAPSSPGGLSFIRRRLLNTPTMYELKEEEGVVCTVPFSWEEKPGTPKASSQKKNTFFSSSAEGEDEVEDEEKSISLPVLSCSPHFRDIAIVSCLNLPPPPPSKAASHVRSLTAIDTSYGHSRNSSSLGSLLRGAVFCGSNLNHRHYNDEEDDIDPFQVAMEFLINEDEPKPKLAQKKSNNEEDKKEKEKKKKEENGGHFRSHSAMAMPWQWEEDDGRSESFASCLSRDLSESELSREYSRDASPAIPIISTKTNKNNNSSNNNSSNNNSGGGGNNNNEKKKKTKPMKKGGKKWTMRDLLYRTLGARARATATATNETHIKTSLLQANHSDEHGSFSSQSSLTSDSFSSPTPSLLSSLSSSTSSSPLSSLSASPKYLEPTYKATIVESKEEEKEEDDDDDEEEEEEEGGWENKSSLHAKKKLGRHRQSLLSTSSQNTRQSKQLQGKKKRSLPYGQGLLGCIGFGSSTNSTCQTISMARTLHSSMPSKKI